ncbi:MAG: tRNA-guanine transglycosylase, partial [bacterium]
QRLYTWLPGMDTPEGVRRADGKFYKFLYILDDEHRRDAAPVDAHCDCILCRNHSRAYLHHLFKVGDPYALRLATAHNLRFYGRLMELLRDE